MKKKKSYTETVKRDRVVAVFCDFCGTDIQKITSERLESDLKDLYEFDGSGNSINADVEVQIRMSNSWPEMGSSKTIELDVCPSCFKNEILSRAKTSNISESEW